VTPPTPTECRWCGHPVHAATGEHPCCAIWIGKWGHRTCVACSESRKLNRMYLERKKREAQEKAKRRRAAKR
jgi:hypothetical protein